MEDLRVQEGGVEIHQGLESLKSKKESLEINTVFDREPMKLLKDRSSMYYGRGSLNDSGS